MTAEAVKSRVSVPMWFDPPEEDGPDSAQKLSSAVDRATELKPFPAVAAEVIKVMNESDFVLGDLEVLINKDPALSAAFLKVANSPMYARATACDSVGMALVRLGDAAVQGIVAGLSALGMFKDNSGVGAVVRDHCAGSASIAKTLANEWSLRSADQVFLCGLMHDVGKLLLMQFGDLNYATVPAPMLEAPDVVHTREHDELGYDHALLGARVMREWGMPDVVAHTVAWHHQPERAFEAGGTVALLVALLRLSDAIDYQIRTDRTLNPDWLDALATGGACVHLGMSGADLRRCWEPMVDARDEMLSILT